MKKSLATIILSVAMTAGMTMSGVAYEIDFPCLRVADGVYLGDGLIKTEDGNLWEYDFSDEDRFRENGEIIFREGESVRVLFDMMATPEVTDDIILDVHSNEY